MMSDDEHDFDIDPKSVQDKSVFMDKVDQSLYDARVHILHGELTEFTCYESARVLQSMGLKVSVEDPAQTIRIVLNSVGGGVFNGLLIFDSIAAIRRRGIDVFVEVRGLAASMAAILLQAGTKRVSSKYTRFMLHEVSDIAFGKTTEVEEQAIELRKVNGMLAQILAARTGKSVEEIEQKMRKKDLWMSAAEALAFGLIDEVV